MDYRYGWHIRPARSHDSDHRMGSRVFIRPREMSHLRNPTIAPPQFHRANPPIQRSQNFEREEGYESADMSISEESADDDLHIAQAEEPALPAQEEMGVHQEVDVELELSLTGGRKKKNQHGAYGASTASVDARPSSADIHPFLSLSISSPSTTVTVRQPPSPHAPSSSLGQGCDDVGKAGIGGLSLNLGEAMFSEDLKSHIMQRENNETFEEASVDDVDWDWRERLVHGATSGRGKEERSVNAASEVEAGAVEGGMGINSQCGETIAVVNAAHALETIRETTGSKRENSMPNAVGQQGDKRPKPPPLVATCLPVPPICPQSEAAPHMASPLPPHTLLKRRAFSDMPPAAPPVQQGATLAVVQAYPGFEIVDSSSDDDDGFSILVNSVPRKDAKAGPTISPPPPTISLKPPAAPPKPPHPSSPSNGGPSGAAVQPSAAPGVGSVRGKVGSGIGRGLGKTGGPMKWQRPLTKPRSAATPPVLPLPSNKILAARGLAPKKVFLPPAPSAAKAVRGFGSSYTRMGHSYTLVRAPLSFPPATKPITSPLPSSGPAPSVPPPAAPVVPPISSANRVEGSRLGGAEAPPAAEKYSRKRANQLVRGGSTPKKSGPPSTSVQATSGPVEAQTSVGAKQRGVEKPTFASEPVPRPLPTRGSSKKAVLWKMAKVWRMHASSPTAGSPLLRFSGRGSKAKQSLAGGSRWTVLSKLKRERKVESLYVRSEGGFALLRSRVRSLVGSSLRWTKTMQEEAKRVSSVWKRMRGRGWEGMGSEGGEVVQEATKAVALAERAKREKKQKAKAAKAESSKAKGEGRQRYKVGAAGKALHRLPGEGKAWRAPRRAQIGGASYVRIGASSVLVRDPNSAAKHTASARVRYSLNNARLRKVKARAYCQYFCRFGKCGKKEKGECGYIHDPDKVAVCSNWLNAVCAEHNCLLTHEVRVERMPDCSFFREGICVVEECPYRHVNVNPKAAVCQGFLRGYCAQGDKCTQKHTFMCPDQSALGACSKGSHCKLQHKGPEGDQKGALRSTVQAARGRYFEGKRKREGAEEEEERKEEGSAKRAKHGGSQEEEEEEDFILI